MKALSLTIALALAAGAAMAQSVVGITAAAPPALRSIYTSLVKQARDVRKIIVAFNRHPHRNGILNRKSTTSEGVYLTKGQYPHMKAFR